jgi:hypothetical protein
MPHGFDDPLALGAATQGAGAVGARLNNASGPVEAGTTLEWLYAFVVAHGQSACAHGFKKGPFAGNWAIQTNLADQQIGFMAGPALGIAIALQKEQASGQQKVVWWWDWTNLA